MSKPQPPKGASEGSIGKLAISAYEALAEGELPPAMRWSGILIVYMIAVFVIAVLLGADLVGALLGLLAIFIVGVGGALVLTGYDIRSKHIESAESEARSLAIEVIQEMNARRNRLRNTVLDKVRELVPKEQLRDELVAEIESAFRNSGEDRDLQD